MSTTEDQGEKAEVLSGITGVSSENDGDCSKIAEVNK